MDEALPIWDFSSRPMFYPLFYNVSNVPADFWTAPLDSSWPQWANCSGGTKLAACVQSCMCRTAMKIHTYIPAQVRSEIKIFYSFYGHSWIKINVYWLINIPEIIRIMDTSRGVAEIPDELVIYWGNSVYLVSDKWLTTVCLGVRQWLKCVRLSDVADGIRVHCNDFGGNWRDPTGMWS